MIEHAMDWAYVGGMPPTSGLLRATPEDFVVDEELGFEPAGEGEHVYLLIRKRGENTAWIAKQLAKLAQVNKHDVSYAGLKDRNAVTRQWFSVYLPGNRPISWSLLDSDSIQVEQVTRHTRKLRRGDHEGNHFKLVVRELEGGSQEDLSLRCARVNEQGVPNYFGPQRFGHDGNNLQQAQAHLVEGQKIRNRQTRGLILSAARSYLFNEVLSKRVVSDSWREGTGPMWGRGRLSGSEDSVAFETEVLSPHQAWCDALEHVGLKQERRPLACLPQSFQADLADEYLSLAFFLPPGCYATSVLREIVSWREPAVNG